MLEKSPQDQKLFALFTEVGFNALLPKCIVNLKIATRGGFSGGLLHACVVFFGLRSEWITSL